MKILVVDDDPIVLQSCKRVLEAEGVMSRTATTVAEAESLLAEEAFELMVTDINMPGKNGFAMIETAKAIKPEMPILVMTGYLTPGTVEKCLRLGAGRHIAKPFTPAELVAAIKKTQRP